MPRAARAVRVLVSAFEPFDGRAVNASAAALEVLRADPPRGVDLAVALLPVVGRTAPRRLLAAVRRARPSMVVALGEAAGSSSIAVERIALNLRDYPIADNAGRTVRDRPVVDGAPLALESTLPVTAMVEAIRAAGVPAQRSLSAGTFLCNEVMYALLHAMSDTTPAGFVHLPLLPEQVEPRAPRPSMSADTAARGLRAAIERAVATR